jgi:hypothetical protein
MKNILILFLLAITSCSPYYTLHPKGEVIQTEQNRVRVSFTDIIHPHKTGAAWFYFPGIGEMDTSNYNIIVKIQDK